MTFREKLADWISGGKLSESRSLFHKAARDRFNFRMALHEIVSRDTPKAAPAAKRAANIARKALGK